jgi:hypothetical protein
MPNKPHGRVVRIEVEWEDGLVRRADGDDAQAIHEDWLDLSLLRQLHGGRYQGPIMRDVRGPSPGGPATPPLLGGEKGTS